MRVTVVGDTLLDEDLIGSVRGVSPDAEVPVLDAREQITRPGGAGLVAALLQRDGHDVMLVTALSDDEGGARLRRYLGGVEIVAVPSGAPTPVKRRLRTNDRTICRVDEGCEPPPVPRVHAEALAAVVEAETDALIVADYGRGITKHQSLRAALQHRGRDVPLIWDPHPRGTEPVSAARLVTPNLAEAASAAGTRPRVADAGEAARRLRARYGCGGVVVTLGEDGATLVERDGEPIRLAATPVRGADACGAGDRFASTVATVLAAGGDAPEAVAEAISTTGSFLASGGVSSLAFAFSPIAERAEADATALARSVRASGGTVVATGGCFDLMHAGHVRTLAAARELGDCLIVCLNSDASVRRLKGAQRPIIGEQDRAELLAALACVDAVLVFDEDGPEAAIASLKPDIWVKGGDYSADALPETRLLESWGGRTVTMPYHLGRSTTGLAEALAPLGAKAAAYDDLDALVQAVKAAARSGDQVLVMSNGGFGGVHQKLLDALA